MIKKEKAVRFILTRSVESFFSAGSYFSASQILIFFLKTYKLKSIHYNRKNHTYQTTTVNPVFEFIACISDDFGQKNSGQPNNFYQLSASVAGAGLEPTTFGL